MYSPLISWARYVFLASLALAVVFVLPATWFPFQLGKLSIFGLLLAICAILFVIGRGGRELVRAHGFPLAFFVAALPAVYALSSYFSRAPSLAFSGYSIETDTVVFTLFVALTFLLSFALFRTLRGIKTLFSVVFWTLVAATGFQAIQIIFGGALIPFDVFADRSSNLVGKWNDLGLLAGLLTMLLVARAELSSGLTVLRKSLIGGGIAALIVLLGVINFGLAWGFLLVFSIAIALVAFLMQKIAASEMANMHTRSVFERMPWFAVAVAATSLIFLLFGTQLNTALTSMFPVSSLEVRPSYTSTLDVINVSREGSAGRVFIGTGPNTFGQSWLTHKPTEVNQSVFWNLDFNVGFSTLMTALGSVGLLGVLAWLVPFMLVLAALVRAMRLQALSKEERVAAVMAGMASIFLLSSIILYVPSQNLILLGLAVAGATFGFLWRQGRSNADHDERSSSVQNLGIAIVSILLIGVSVWSAFVTERRFLAQAYTGSAAVALQNGDVETAFQKLDRAVRIEPIPDALRLGVDVSNLQIQALAQDQTTPAEQIQQQFTALAEQAVAAGQQVVATDGDDYRSHLTLARFYDVLATLQIQGAYESAKQAYSDASARAPHNPQIPLALARLEAAAGNVELSEEALTRALTLKANYTDAILFAVQLSVAQNNIPNAIRAATAAVQTAPGVAPIWFQLGLLYYAAGDTTNAALALEQAVLLVPDYANAKYFLGLSYYAQEKNAEAIALFQDLAQSNPDNAEVSLILTNMAAGREPFASSTPPFVPPEDRPTAPIAQ